MQGSVGRYKHFSAFRLSLALFIVNVIGAVDYVRAVSPSWVIPQERAAGIHALAGEPVVWAGAVLPFITVFGLLDVLWGAYLCIGKKWRSGYFWLMTVATWLIAVWIDFAHH
jgi:hypothetical protein